MSVQPDNTHKRTEAETPARDLLIRLGYTYVPRDALAGERDGEREVVLKRRLWAALVRLNPWLTEDQAHRVIFRLARVNAVGLARNQAVHELLTYGLALDLDGPGGRETRTVRFFDFARPEPGDGPNEFVVTTQFRVRRGSERDLGHAENDEKLVIPDLVLFVNGLPLVVLEAKSRTLSGDLARARAVRQLSRYQELRPEWRGRGAPELFDFNLLCVALGGDNAWYGPIGAGEAAYAEWKLAPRVGGQGAAENPADDALAGQDRLIAGLLAPRTVLDLLRDFVVYEPEGGRLVKKLPRYQQYRAVTRAMERIRTKAKPEERGGVVWHTPGSGTSLTMLWLAVKLRREPALRDPTILVVADRTQLDRQIAGTFERSGFPAPEHAANTRELRAKLTAGVGRTIVTTIQKLEDALTGPGGRPDLLNPADNVVVLVDEAHRTQYGLLAAKMRQALPRATFVGFTGTPIDQGFARSAMRQFGPLLDTYTIPQSVEDRATVPIYYEARRTDLAIQGPNPLDRLFDALFHDQPDEIKARITRRYVSKETLALADRRIEMIALDVAEHFGQRVRPNGFKAQLVAPSREAAVKYAGKLGDFGVRAYPVITTSNDDDSFYDEARALDHDQVIAQFMDPSGEAEVLVVVDLLLTGFDAPIEQVLYLDRGLREHALLQAIARVNRRCALTRDGIMTEKTYGLVVDYWGVSRDLEAALAEFDPADRRDLWRALEGDPAATIESVANQAEAFFRGRDPGDVWSCVDVFAAHRDTHGNSKADLFERFSAAYRAFAACLDRFLPDPRALPYVERLARLTRIRAYARATFLRENAAIDWDGISAKVKELIDRRIDASARVLMEPVLILDQDFARKIDGLPHDEARASVMEHALRAQIKERLAENPVFYERLSQQLERIIQQMRDHLIDAATAVRELRQVRQTALNIAEIARRLGLDDVSFAVYELLESADAPAPTANPADRPTGLRESSPPYQVRQGGPVDEQRKGIAVALERIVARGQGIVDWQNNEDVQRLMRRDIKRELRQLEGLNEAEINDLAASMVEIARRQLAE